MYIISCDSERSLNCGACKLQEPTKHRKTSTGQSAGGGGGGGDESGSSAEHHEKFRELKLSSAMLFYDDLTIHIGSPNFCNIMHAMRSEHEGDGPFNRKTGEDLTAQNSHHVQIVSPKSEWNTVMKGEPKLHLIEDQNPHDLKIPGREIEHTLSHYFKLASLPFEQVQSQDRLMKEEVLALRLWTGPMNSRYAYFFRKINAQAGGEQNPTFYLNKASGLAVERYVCPYVTTLHALNSGIMRLARVWKLPPNLRVYRGFKNIGPVNIEQLDMFGCSGGVEPCVLAATSSPSKADHYSQGGLKLEIEVGQVNKGADISWLSQFPLEKEVLFPAMSNIEFSQCCPSQDHCSTSGDAIVDCKMESVACKLEGGVTAFDSVYQVSITANWKCKTLDEFIAAHTVGPTLHDDPGHCATQLC